MQTDLKHLKITQITLIIGFACRNRIWQREMTFFLSLSRAICPCNTLMDTKNIFVILFLLWLINDDKNNLDTAPTVWQILRLFLTFMREAVTPA